MPYKEWLRALLIGVKQNIITITISREKTNNRIGLKPLAFNEFFQHGLRILVDAASLNPHNLIIQNSRKLTREIPGLKKWSPINELGNLSQ